MTVREIQTLITEEREKQGYTYREFAKMIGCDKGTLLKWKRHKTANLDVELADKALKALGVSATIGKE